MALCAALTVPSWLQATRGHECVRESLWVGLQLRGLSPAHRGAVAPSAPYVAPRKSPSALFAQRMCFCGSRIRCLCLGRTEFCCADAF